MHLRGQDLPPVDVQPRDLAPRHLRRDRRRVVPGLGGRVPEVVQGPEVGLCGNSLTFSVRELKLNHVISDHWVVVQ